MLTLIAFVVIFGTIVFVHELGHFTVAKLAGIRVYEFALGFGPILLKKTKGETKYSLRAFPLGGFVKMAGMDEPEDEQEKPAEDDEGSFNNKSLPWRLGTIAAGPLMNFFFAILLFVLYFTLIAVPPTITFVEPHSPGDIAGLMSGDLFISVNGETVENSERIVELIGLSPELEMKFVVRRQQELVTISVIPENREGLGRVGITIDSKPQYPFFMSLKASVVQTGALTWQLIRDIGMMLTGQTKVEVSGPIGIVQIVGETARYGLPNLIILAIILNINLGLLNLLPVPVLDGGWILILLIEAVRGKPLKPETRGIAQFIGLALLMALMLFATFKDLSRINLFSR